VNSDRLFMFKESVTSRKTPDAGLRGPRVNA
jgi:hypothetical protein